MTRPRLAASLLVPAALVSLAVLGGCGGGSAADEEAAAPATASDAELVSLTYSVGGMTCSGCVDGITTAVAGLPGVAECDVSLDEGRMVVRVADPAAGEAVVETVRGMNFTVAPAEAPAAAASGETAGS